MQHEAVSFFLTGVQWRVQLGSHWKNVLQKPHGGTTIAILVITSSLWVSIKYEVQAGTIKIFLFPQVFPSNLLLFKKLSALFLSSFPQGVENVNK